MKALVVMVVLLCCCGCKVTHDLSKRERVANPLMDQAATCRVCLDGTLSSCNRAVVMSCERGLEQGLIPRLEYTEIKQKEE
jgi:hypothetical protein